MKSAVYFLSTGRCGSQWFAKSMADHYAEAAEITHEPTVGYFPAKKYLRSYDTLDELLLQPKIAEYFNHIRTVLRDKIYIETGWPSYPAMPLIKRALDGKIKFVHLVRHPVYAALSHATHNIYKSREKSWISGYVIDPFDRGVVQKNIQNEWKALSEYEKCLFWWTEINLYALELKELNPDIPYLLVRYEDLFVSRQTAILDDIVRFAELPLNKSFKKSLDVKVDNYRKKTVHHDWERIFEYPGTISLARRFGYDIAEVDTQYINQRYVLSPVDRAKKFGKWVKAVGRKISQRLGNNPGPRA